MHVPNEGVENLPSLSPISKFVSALEFVLKINSPLSLLPPFLNLQIHTNHGSNAQYAVRITLGISQYLLSNLIYYYYFSAFLPTIHPLNTQPLQIISIYSNNYAVMQSQ